MESGIGNECTKGREFCEDGGGIEKKWHQLPVGMDAQ